MILEKQKTLNENKVSISVVKICENTSCPSVKQRAHALISV
jgi:hypothetical protein